MDKSSNMFDHCDYSSHFEEDKEEEVYLNDGLDASDEDLFNKYIKYGDELLIDMVRVRPYLYDKTEKNYKDINMKENAWTEIATALNITLAECKNRWLRLRQRFSKERQLREQETRSGSKKPTRQKWVLFDNLAFLEKHVIQRRSFSNVNLTKLGTSGPSGILGKSLKTQRSMVLQDDHEMSVNNFNHKTSTSTSGQQSLHPLSPSSLCCTPLTNEETSIPSTSSCQTSTLETEDSDVVRPPSSCFSGNQQRVFKKRKIDPVETVFYQMNNTLNTMATEICSRKIAVNENDTDVLIGKLVTAELQMATEPHKSTLKQKFMELLYFKNPT